MFAYRLEAIYRTHGDKAVASIVHTEASIRAVEVVAARDGWQVISIRAATEVDLASLPPYGRVLFQMQSIKECVNAAPVKVVKAVPVEAAKVAGIAPVRSPVNSARDIPWPRTLPRSPLRSAPVARRPLHTRQAACPQSLAPTDRRKAAPASSHATQSRSDPRAR